MFDQLHEGVPAWLLDSLTEWLKEHFPTRPVRQGRARQVDERLVRAWERQRKLPLGNFVGLVSKCRNDDELFLDTCDWLLFRLSDTNRARARVASEQLEIALKEAGSVWRVVVREPDVYQLERRVADGVRGTLAEALSVNDRAGHHLREAWSHAFGRTPNADHAYSEAVKAVETVTQPIVSPKNPKATLGTVIASLSDKPQKWRFSISMTDGSDPIERIVPMLRLLWKGNKRHGTPDMDQPSGHNVSEAQAAVVLAATLVHWFGGGHVTLARTSKGS